MWEDGARMFHFGDEGQLKKKKKTIGYTNHMCDTKLQVHLSKIPTCKKLLEIIKRI